MRQHNATISGLNERFNTADEEHGEQVAGKNPQANHAESSDESDPETPMDSLAKAAASVNRGPNHAQPQEKLAPMKTKTIKTKMTFPPSVLQESRRMTYTPHPGGSGGDGASGSGRCSGGDAVNNSVDTSSEESSDKST
ncbi:unnamed protein product [Sympodiomycopsis kandeliae]